MDGDDEDTSRQSDAQLLRRWQTGDAAAGEALVVRHYLGLKKFFINAVNDEAARDLTQETLLKLTDKRTQFEFRSSVKTYLFRIARYTLYDFIKKKRRGRFEPLEHSVIDQAALRPSELVGRIRSHSALLDHIRALPVETKQLLELYYWQDFTARELAEIFELKETTLKARIYEARDKLAKAMRAGSSSALATVEIEAELRELGKLFEQGPPLDPTQRIER